MALVNKRLMDSKTLADRLSLAGMTQANDALASARRSERIAQATDLVTRSGIAALRNGAIAAAASIAVVSRGLLSASSSMQDLGRASRKAGADQSWLHETAAAAERVGGSLSDVTGVLGNLQQMRVKALQGDAEASRWFRRAGIDVRSLRHAKPEQIFDRVAEAVARLGETERAQLLSEGLGGNMLLRDFQGRLPELRTQVRADTGGLTDGAVRAGERLRETIASVKQAAESIFANALPALNPVMDKLQGALAPLVSDAGPKFAAALGRAAEGIAANWHIIEGGLTAIGRAFDGLLTLVEGAFKVLRAVGETVGVAAGEAAMALERIEDRSNRPMARQMTPEEMRQAQGLPAVSTAPSLGEFIFKVGADLLGRPKVELEQAPRGAGVTIDNGAITAGGY